MSRPRKRIFVPKRIWLFPHGIEREYKALMLVFVEACKTAVVSNMELINSIVNNSPFKTDEDDDYLATGIATSEVARRIVELSGKLRDSFTLRVDQRKVERELIKVANRANEFNSKQFRAILRAALQVDVFQNETELTSLLGVWAQDNVRLIKSIPEQYFDDVERITSEGFKSGALTRDVAEQIADAGGVTQKRAMFIARDQIGSLNGDLTKYRQTSAGIDSYVWHTSGDSRVRPAHAARNGITYKWSDPPSGGPPGNAINCRCVALPVIDLDKINVVGAPVGKR